MSQSLGPRPRARQAESDQDGGAFRRLATYGTFPPGRDNHHVVAPLGGRWIEGWVEGTTRPARRGRWQGYAGFEPCLGGSRLAAWLLEADALPQAWVWLDAFEGDAFRRITVPFHTHEGHCWPAQIYVVRDDG